MFISTLPTLLTRGMLVHLRNVSGIIDDEESFEELAVLKIHTLLSTTLARNMIIYPLFPGSNYTTLCRLLYTVLDSRYIEYYGFYLHGLFLCLCHCLVRLDCYGLLWRLCCGRNANCWHIIMSLARAQYKDNRIQVGLQ